MKVVMYEQASLAEKRAIVEGIRIVRAKFNEDIYPALDEYFENEFGCTLMYSRNTGIIGFAWKYEADYSWFMLRCSA
jgi:hypothetical protein